MPIIKGKVIEGGKSILMGGKHMIGLLLNRYDNYRVFHSKDELVRSKSHVNSIESWEK